MEVEAPTHLHFIIWAYERIEAGTGNYIDNVTIDVLAESPTHALEKARFFVPRKGGYSVRSVIEHLDGQCTHGN